MPQAAEDNPQGEIRAFTMRQQITDYAQSSWLREALSDLDPKEYDKLPFVGNPLGATAGDRPSRSSTKPIFRIMASGSVGSTEVWQCLRTIITADNDIDGLYQ